MLIFHLHFRSRNANFQKFGFEKDSYILDSESVDKITFKYSVNISPRRSWKMSIFTGRKKKQNSSRNQNIIMKQPFSIFSFQQISQHPLILIVCSILIKLFINFIFFFLRESNDQMFMDLPKSWQRSRCFKKNIIRPMVLAILVAKSACLYWRLCAFGVIRRPNLTAVSMYVSELTINIMKIFSWTAEMGTKIIVMVIWKVIPITKFSIKYTLFLYE